MVEISFVFWGDIYFKRVIRDWLFIYILCTEKGREKGVELFAGKERFFWLFRQLELVNLPLC